MKPTFNEKLIAYLTLLSGLSISAVAVYYSVIGLTAIFAAAVIPIVIMGITLEVSKLVATVWLKQNWNIAPKTIRLYLTIAVIILMIITSLGIFGFLSKAHSDQSLIGGDVQSKLAIYDEKIKTAKENIEADRRQLKQMDEAVDQVMARSTTEEGASRSNAIRKAQTRDRSALVKNIEANQKLIAAINDEAAPIRAEIRKVEAEVGPLKYIAAFIYGETDKTILEKAVTWVIIIIVVVFDPLAVVLLLASQYSFQNFRERQKETITNKEEIKPLAPIEEPITVSTEGDSPEKESDVVSTATVTEPLPIIIKNSEDEFDINKHPYLFKVPTQRHPPNIEPVTPQVYKSYPVLVEENIDKINESVNNIEQKEIEQLTTDSVITEEDYRNISQEKLEIEIERYAGMLRNKQIRSEDIPETILPAVKSRV
jgi:flagellar basal body-associated protein FliL